MPDHLRPTQVALVGTGRVAQALGRRLQAGGVQIYGIWGRRPEAVAQAIEFVEQGGRIGVSNATSGADSPGGPAGASASTGEASSISALGSDTELRGADRVIVAVADTALEAVVHHAAENGGVRDGSLWIHTSGRHDLVPLTAAQDMGARVGSLHPVCPIPDRDVGFRQLDGSHAVLQAADEGSRADLEDLAESAGMVSHWMEGGDRVLYHAACSMAANGLTALFDVVSGVMAGAGLPKDAAASLPEVLMRAALDAVAQSGAVRALSGPAVRGDAGALADHLEHLSSRRPEALPVYRALLGRAALMAFRRGDVDAPTYTTMAAELQFGPSRRG